MLTYLKKTMVEDQFSERPMDFGRTAVTVRWRPICKKMVLEAHKALSFMKRYIAGAL
jgi:hypothetical protein